MCQSLCKGPSHEDVEHSKQSGCLGALYNVHQSLAQCPGVKEYIALKIKECDLHRIRYSIELKV